MLAHTLEVVELPSDLMGLVEGRSSWARLGLSVHMTAPKIDPGFCGTIALEMTNVGPATIQLTAGEDEPAQLMFATIVGDLDIDEVYGNRPTDQFQYQDSPVPRQKK